MPTLNEDFQITSQAAEYSVSELQDCSIAIDATYYLQLQLDEQPNEPLLSALGGVTGIQTRIEQDLSSWEAHKITPFFIFDGQPLTGQDEVTAKRGREANLKTDSAWELYFSSDPVAAVKAFGQNTSAFRPQTFYRLLQGILRARGLHFLVAPSKAAAQIAYFDLVDSDQCAGIMGSTELMLYPIADTVIRSIDWERQAVAAISKKHILKTLNVSESVFVDAMLMVGTSFLPPFPPLEEQAVVKNQHPSVGDALNQLRAHEKSVTVLCSSYDDVLKAKDPNWLDKYRKARMAVDHFIYIAENGEIQVHNPHGLTNDHHLYMGLQLPAELFHYLNTGLIQPRILSAITHTQLYVLPTLDGTAPNEYRKLVTDQTLRIKEAALSLLTPRLNRAIAHKPVIMKVWYDSKVATPMRSTPDNRDSSSKFSSWNVTEDAIKKHFPDFVHGSVYSEVMALQKPEFPALTLSNRGTKVKGLAPSLIKSLTIWRFLHIRGYVDDKHQLTNWGSALAAALAAFQPTVAKYSNVPYSFETILVGIELIRFDLLNAKHKHEELRGLPMNGTEEEQQSLLLVSRCATLLKMRHEAFGYTGPLSKSLLAFRSLASEVRSADRDLVEGILAFTFMVAQADRKRDDNWELSASLPFIFDPDVALGIAVKTFYDDVVANDSELASKKEKFPSTFVPYATHFAEDLDIACKFFHALHVGVQASSDVSAADKAVWAKASKYLEVRS
ncbi:protein MKT1 [Cladorrhinum sp. PSN259]|nr:protein MKT1 [Cladorrhinum sp. PSN259]